MTYKTFCLKCEEERRIKQGDIEEIEENNLNNDVIKGEMKFYYGESSKTAFERGVQHEKDYVSKLDDSHMYKHFTEAHGDSDIKDIRFGMTVLRSHPSAFHRQVSESVLIFRNQNNLNSKSMYDRCVIPRLQVMIGERTEKEEEAREANDNDDDNENALEIIGNDKRKKRNKGRKRGNAAPPSKKQRPMPNDDSKVDPEVKNLEEVEPIEPKIASNAMTQNYFSIFNTNSKFKNAPGKVLKKPRVKNVAASKKRKVKFIEGIKSIDKYFSTGNEEVAANDHVL